MEGKKSVRTRETNTSKFCQRPDCAKYGKIGYCIHCQCKEKSCHGDTFCSNNKYNKYKKCNLCMTDKLAKALYNLDPELNGVKVKDSLLNLVTAEIECEPILDRLLNILKEENEKDDEPDEPESKKSKHKDGKKKSLKGKKKSKGRKKSKSKRRKKSKSKKRRK